jgi:hypothetical protein
MEALFVVAALAYVVWSVRQSIVATRARIKRRERLNGLVDELERFSKGLHTGQGVERGQPE